MSTRTPDQHSFRLLLTLGAVSVLGLACATVDNTAVAAQKVATKAAAVTTDANATVYYWYDGKKKRKIVVAPNLVADFSSDSVIKDASQATKTTAGTSKASKVFVDANGGMNARALPGNVIVRFKNAMSQEQVNSELQQFDTQVVNPIGGSGKSWLVKSAPGMASLEMANKIHESGLVQSAAPNWYRPRATK